MSESMKTRIIFAETPLEMIPKKLWGHPSIKADSKRRGRPPNKILLNISKHYKAMVENKIPPKKHGRPDIIHRALLITLDSPMNQEGLLEIYVHTVEDKIIWINPKTRLPLDFYRFEGLIIQLLKTGRVPPKGREPLLKIIDVKLGNLLKDDRKNIYLLTETGKKYSNKTLKNMLGNTLLIGGFQEGDFSEEITKMADERVNISPYKLHTSTTACLVLTQLYNQYFQTRSKQNKLKRK